MLAWEMCKSAFDSLVANKLRSLLTMLGIIVGVGSIIAIVAVGQGGQQAIIAAIDNPALSEAAIIVPKAILAGNVTSTADIPAFSPADTALALATPGVEDVYSTPSQSDVITAGGKTTPVTVQAGPSFLPLIAQFEVVQGRMFLPIDTAVHRRVIVITQSVAKSLFGSDSAGVGRLVGLEGQLFEVIGVAKSTSTSILSALAPSLNVYMPTTTFMDLYPSTQNFELELRVAPGYDKNQVAARLIAVLDAKYHGDLFENAAGFIAGITNTVTTVTGIITTIVGAIASIALVVGGIGVMNIMLVSVTERTREIGIRISLGASRTTILWQFLIEAIVLTTLGGLIGITIGWLIAALASTIGHLPSLISWQAALGSFLFSAFVGILCGIYPASRASRLNPIDALRYE